jgi:hypothetical protein
MKSVNRPSQGRQVLEVALAASTSTACRFFLEEKACQTLLPLLQAEAPSSPQPLIGVSLGLLPPL